MDYTKIRRGKRADLGDICWKSAWEANTARWLCWMEAEGHIEGWLYEPQTFTFPKVERGAVCYCPDFLVWYKDGSHEWIEVKGRETSRDRTKWKRFRKWFPEHPLTVIGREEYRLLEREFSGRLKWEK